MPSEEPVPADPGGDMVDPESPPESVGSKGRIERQKRKYAPRKTKIIVDAPVYFKKTDEAGEPVETKEEQNARLSREANESWHKTHKDWLIHGVFAFLLVVVTLTCLYIIARVDSVKQPEAIKLASTLLTAIITGGASFFAGKAAGSQRPS